MRNKRLIIIFSILLSVTAIVLLSSMIFSVKKLNTRCLNYSFTDPQLDTEILSIISSAEGKSIFTLNEDKLIKSIEENVHDVKVINLERKFPDRVTVHYVRLFDYYEVAIDGAFYSLTYEGKVIKESEKAASEENRIRIKTSETSKPGAGELFYNGINRDILTELTATFERLDLSDEKAASRFDFIDLEKRADTLYIGVTNSDIVIKILNVSDLSVDSQGRTELFKKVRLGYSLFLQLSLGNNQGDGKMVEVINSKDVRDISSDYSN